MIPIPQERRLILALMRRRILETANLMTQMNLVRMILATQKKMMILITSEKKIWKILKQRKTPTKKVEIKNLPI